MKKYETYRCSICGNEVEVQSVGEGKLACCGKEMENITKNLTAVNLMKAFAGESMARNKYDMFADVAEKEGLHRIAAHFRETALNEMWHARAEYKEYNKLTHGFELDTTAKNLIYGADGERYEHSIMYPEFEAIAKEDGYSTLARLFRAIAKVELEHEREYLELKSKLEKDGFFEDEKEESWVCEICGHIHRGKKAPNACALCGAPKEYFKREFLG
jgi:desulfoferrodoxin-like iron-binding protein